jgi:hypothetical protein
MKQFLEFVDRRQRDGRKHLKIIERILRNGKFQVYSHIEEDEPYIFVKSPKKLSFEGIRIYEIGEMIAYRIQKEEKTHPYGKARLLDLEEMFNDFMSENMKEKEAGKKVMQNLIEEIQKFFLRTADAEKEMIDARQDDPGLILKTGGTDYSSTVLNRL